MHEVDAGDVRALYLRYGPLVRRRCRTLLRDAVLAEDALQETFLKVVVHRDDVAFTDQPLRWLYRVSDRTCLDALRKRRRAPYDYSAEADRLSTVPHPNVAVDDMLGALRLLATFDEESQRVAILTFVDGMTQEEAAHE